MGYYIVSPNNSNEFPNQLHILAIKMAKFVKVIEAVEMLGIITLKCSDRDFHKLQALTAEMDFSCIKQEKPLFKRKRKPKAKKDNVESKENSDNKQE